MAEKSKRNQNLMQLVKRAHGMVENTDVVRHRHSQDQIGAILGMSREIEYGEVDIDGMNGEWVRVNRAHNRKYVILYCHGGGYSTGSSVYARPLTSKLATASSMDVLAFDYRLAPEHPYPAALEDAMKAWDYLMYQGYGARDVVVAGDSAGGNLALALTLMLKSQGRFVPRALVLMSPWTDMTSSGESHITRAQDDPVLNKEYIDRMIEAYAGGEKDLHNPLISPLFGDLTGFPPVSIQVGDNEILLDDATRLKAALEGAGASVRMEVFEGMWHVFQMSPFKKAYVAMDKNAQFVIDVCLSR